MGIKAVITTEEHSKLSDALKTLYKQEGQHFVLDADGIDTHPATQSLKRALETERDNVGKASRELKELRDKLGDMSPDQAADAIKRIREIEEAQRLGDIPDKFKKQFDEAVAAKVESIKASYESKEKNYAKQIEEANNKLSAANGELERLTIDGEVRNVAAKRGLNDWAVEDAIMHARGMFKLREGKPLPLKGDQIVYSSKKPGDPMPIEEWLDMKLTEKPGWLKPNGGGGADNSRRQGNTGTFVISREQARDPRQYERAKEEAKKAGQELQIADA